MLQDELRIPEKPKVPALGRNLLYTWSRVSFFTQPGSYRSFEYPRGWEEDYQASSMAVETGPRLLNSPE